MEKLVIVVSLLALSNLSVAQLDCGDKKNLQCLDVFTREPSNLPKCYCTDVCSDHLDDVTLQCASGQAHADGCGSCLTCAKALGEPCGGKFNILGQCASGLSCLVEIPGDKRTPNERKTAEQASAGICTSDRDSRCPKSGVTQSAQNRNISCRPGRLGILVEALYCPSRSDSLSGSQMSLQSPSTTTRAPPKRPFSVLHILGDFVANNKK